MSLKAQDTQTGYKETPIGKIPEEWGVAQLGEYIDILTGDSFSSKKFGREGIPLIRIRDIDKNKTETNYNGSYDPKYLIEPGSILIGMDGEFNVHLWGGPKGLLNQRVCRVRSNSPSVLDDRFLYYAIKKPIKVIEAQIRQTTVKHLSKKDIRKIKIPLPPLPEQKKIAEILSTVDNGIQKVDEVIEKTERLKKGLMQKLLTEGIEHKEFKETAIGKIPEEWGAVRLSEAAEYINGYGFSADQWTDTGLPIVRIQNLNNPEEDFNYFDGDLSDKVVISDGDILFSWSATIDVFRWQRGKALLNQHIFKVMPKEGVNKDYLYYALKTTINQLKQRIHGSTMKHFRRRELDHTHMPLPPLPEQKKIAEVLSTVDEKLKFERNREKKLVKIKNGLMQDLLTGKKRVEE